MSVYDVAKFWSLRLVSRFCGRVCSSLCASPTARIAGDPLPAFIAIIACAQYHICLVANLIALAVSTYLLALTRLFADGYCCAWPCCLGVSVSFPLALLPAFGSLQFLFSMVMACGVSSFALWDLQSFSFHSSPWCCIHAVFLAVVQICIAIASF